MIWAAMYAASAAAALVFVLALCRAAAQADRQAEREYRRKAGRMSDKKEEGCPRPRSGRRAAPGQCIHTFEVTDNDCLLCTGWSRQCPRFEEEPHERQ